MDKRAWIYLHTNMTLLKCCLQIRIHKSTKEANLSISLHELSNQLNMDALSHLLHHLLLNYGDDWLFFAKYNSAKWKIRFEIFPRLFSTASRFRSLFALFFNGFHCRFIWTNTSEKKPLDYRKKRKPPRGLNENISGVERHGWVTYTKMEHLLERRMQSMGSV